jgi:hypothetical protein
MSAYYALRHTLLDGRVLRSGDRPGLEQETWALLALYQLLRMAMTDAAATRPGPTPTGPASPPSLLAARRQLTTAQGIITPAAPHPGNHGRAVLATCSPPAAPATAPAPSKAPPPATRPAAATPARPHPRPSPPSTSPISAPPPGTRSRPPGATAARRPPAPTATASPP